VFKLPNCWRIEPVISPTPSEHINKDVSLVKGKTDIVIGYFLAPKTPGVRLRFIDSLA
jgi:hypothetical protein